MDEKKARFIGCLSRARGIVSTACKEAGVSRSAYYKWRAADGEFARAVADVQEEQADFVEDRLMRLIAEGDTTATIFYLKTKGRTRGYTDKPLPGCADGGTSPEGQPRPVPQAVARRVRDKKAYLVKLLKRQGKYTPELAMQAALAAQLLVRVDMLAADIFAPGHSPVNVETSREGNRRESVSPKERLYLDLVQQAQRALRALGMNTDAKERKTDGDGFGEFMQAFKDGE